MTKLRRSFYLPLSVEQLEQRCCLSNSVGIHDVSELSLITEDQAIALAMNDIEQTTNGFKIENRRHTATLTSEGLAITPRPGGPHWQWQLSHVGWADAFSTQVNLKNVLPELDASRTIRFDRGPIIEQYVLKSNSVEQQFVVLEPLDLGDEDLVISGSILSNGVFDSDDDGWVWRTDTGVVSLGDVTVFDADGNEVPATMTVTAQATQITIEASVLRDVQYPLLVDPEIGTNDFRISDMGPVVADFDARNPAVAFNTITNQYLVVWSGNDVKQNNFGVFGQLINAATGAPVGADDFRIDDVGRGGFMPTVAYNQGNNEYLVVFTGIVSGGGGVDIFGHRLTANGALIGSDDFQISSHFAPFNPSFFGRNPDVAYNSINNEYLVVWEGTLIAPAMNAEVEVEVFAARLDASNGNPLSGKLRISDMGQSGKSGFEARDPAVAHNSKNNSYVVVWTGNDDIAPLVKFEYEIFRQRLSNVAIEEGANDFRISDMGPNGDTKYAAVAPDIAYNSVNDEYLVVWQGDDSTNDEFEIFGQRLSGSSASIGANDFRISDLGPAGDANFDAEKPSISYSGPANEYLVVWTGDDNTLPLVEGESEIFGQRLSGVGAVEVGVNDVRLSNIGTNGDTQLDAFAPAIAYNTHNNEFAVVWEGELTNEEFEIFTQRISAATGSELGTNDRRISDAAGGDEFEAKEAAVAYNPTANEYLVVWSGEEVDGEFDIYGQRINALTGSEIGLNDFRISDMGPDGSALYSAGTPAVVYNSVSNFYFVVWRGDDNTAPLVDNEFEIFGQVLTSTGTQIGGNDFRISNMGPNGDINFAARDPSVAHNSAANEYLVVWGADDHHSPLVDNEQEIFAQRVGFGGGEFGANDFRISDMGPDGNASFAASQPDVVYNNLANEYLVVWRGDDDTAPLIDGEFEIFGQRLDAVTGNSIGTNDFRISDMGPDANLAFYAHEPALAYNPVNNHYLVVWAGTDGVPGEEEIYGQRLNRLGTAIGANDFRISDMGPNGDANFDALKPDVAFNSTALRYLVVWRGDDNSAGFVANEFEIFGQELSATGAEVGTNDIRLSDIGPAGKKASLPADLPAIAARTNADGYLVVFDGKESGGLFGNLEREIFGQRFEVGAGSGASASNATRQVNSVNSMSPIANSATTKISPSQNVPTGNRIGTENHGDDRWQVLARPPSAQSAGPQVIIVRYGFGSTRGSPSKIVNVKHVDALFDDQDDWFFRDAALKPAPVRQEIGSRVGLTIK